MPKVVNISEYRPYLVVYGQEATYHVPKDFIRRYIKGEESLEGKEDLLRAITKEWLDIIEG